jgi:hypothetical protein
MKSKLGLLLFCILFIGKVSANENIIKRESTRTFLCAEYDFLVNDLTQEWKQERSWYGLTNANQIVELFINKKNGKFTIITTGTDKIACGLTGGSSSNLIQEE